MAAAGRERRVEPWCTQLITLENGTTSIDIGTHLFPLWERVRGLETRHQLLASDSHYLHEGLKELKEGHTRLAGSIEKKFDRHRYDIDEIHRRINRAIMWLAIAASGVVLQIVRVKLGI